MACASRYVGKGGSHCGLRDVGHGVWVTVCGYVTWCVMVHFSTMLLMRYGGALRCVTFMRYGVLRWYVTTVRYGAALHRCVTAVHYGVLQHYVTTVHHGRSVAVLLYGGAIR